MEEGSKEGRKKEGRKDGSKEEINVLCSKITSSSYLPTWQGALLEKLIHAQAAKKLPGLWKPNFNYRLTFRLLFSPYIVKLNIKQCHQYTQRSNSCFKKLKRCVIKSEMFRWQPLPPSSGKAHL